MRKLIVSLAVTFTLLLSICLTGCSTNIFDPSGNNPGLFNHPLVTKISYFMDNTFDISAGDYYKFEFSISSDMLNTRVGGSFYASGGSGNDIRMLILDSTDYVNWANGHFVTPCYDSGKLTTHSFMLNLTAGTYYLVLDNTFSFISSKQVKIDAGMEWQEYE
ncbi:hypothetical protein [Dehalococcoides mccartyi]|jgi:hypothetical protein|uniref:hypothetical protein n=1 Tax=Dehalococcoides mccartyi TaxID=61435 RepID=UPI0003C87EAB|nr:hypothetical protein [Dehalococcoides mccartyi]AHB14138.1 hypothetical protein GY50_1368 [Dehalococcoides mccartyi GY50]